MPSSYEAPPAIYLFWRQRKDLRFEGRHQAWRRDGTVLMFETLEEQSFSSDVTTRQALPYNSYYEGV